MQKQSRIPESLTIDSKKHKLREFTKPYLLQMSDNHCSYCDEHFFNIGNLLVEHFQNKNDFPELEFEWNNLFIACSSCNSRKKDLLYTENPKPIKPDEIDYSFNKYFHFEFSSGKILAKPNQRAEKTIEYLNLNNEDLVNARLLFISLIIESGKVPDNSYRFIVENI